MQWDLSNWKYFGSIWEYTAWFKGWYYFNGSSLSFQLSTPWSIFIWHFSTTHIDISEKLELIKEIKNSATFSSVDLWASCVKKGWLALPTFCVHFPFYICNPWTFSIFYLQHSKIVEKNKLLGGRQKLLSEFFSAKGVPPTPTPLAENHFGKSPYRK